MTLSVTLKNKFDSFQLDVEFIAQKEITVLFGYSGAGKSLTLKSISGLHTPDSGFIKNGEKVLFDSSKKVDIPPGKRKVGFMFQSGTLFPHLTIKENIIFGGKLLNSGTKIKKFEILAKKYRIYSLKDKYPHEISGGQKQRASLAMILMSDPELLLLDEPFSALDNPLRIFMRECLANVIKHLDIPVLLVTHDIFEAADIGDRMLVFDNGKVVQTGSPMEVIENPVNKEVANLLKIPTLNHP